MAPLADCSSCHVCHCWWTSSTVSQHPAMTYKFTYCRGTQLAHVLIQGASLKEALRQGYKQCQWDSLLEVSTPDNRPLQSLKTQA
jgi:hypothetical protein